MPEPSVNPASKYSHLEIMLSISSWTHTSLCLLKSVGFICMSVTKILIFPFICFLSFFLHEVKVYGVEKSDKAQLFRRTSFVPKMAK